MVIPTYDRRRRELEDKHLHREKKSGSRVGGGHVKPTSGKKGGRAKRLVRGGRGVVFLWGRFSAFRESGGS